MARVFSVFVAAGVIILASSVIAQEQRTDDPFLGAEGCKACHTEVYAAWAKTKHARAMSSLSGNDRTNATCVGCHITAIPNTVAQQITDPKHPNVQCEACHGTGRVHAERATAGTPMLDVMMAVPPEKVCVDCHNDRSPHFRGFFYPGMKGLVHKH